jgi:hypothetical protein
VVKKKTENRNCVCCPQLANLLETRKAWWILYLSCFSLVWDCHFPRTVCSNFVRHFSALQIDWNLSSSAFVIFHPYSTQLRCFSFPIPVDSLQKFVCKTQTSWLNLTLKPLLSSPQQLQPRSPSNSNLKLIQTAQNPSPHFKPLIKVPPNQTTSILHFQFHIKKISFNLKILVELSHFSHF